MAATNRKYVTLLFILLIIVSFIVGSSAFAKSIKGLKPNEIIAAEAVANTPSISTEKLAQKIEANEKLVLIDVRSEEEYVAGYIPGAIWIPRGKLEFVMGTILPDANAEIVIYCLSGNRGALATKTLLALGYKDVRNLNDGIQKWITQGRSLYNDLYGEIVISNFQFSVYANTCFEALGSVSKE